MDLLSPESHVFRASFYDDYGWKFRAPQSARLLKQTRVDNRRLKVGKRLPFHKHAIIDDVVADAQWLEMYINVLGGRQRNEQA